MVSIKLPVCLQSNEVIFGEISGASLTTDCFFHMEEELQGCRFCKNCIQQSCENMPSVVCTDFGLLAAGKKMLKAKLNIY